MQKDFDIHGDVHSRNISQTNKVSNLPSTKQNDVELSRVDQQQKQDQSILKENKDSDEVESQT